jgi:hypothetical protein
MTSWKCIHVSLWKTNITLAKNNNIILVEYYFLVIKPCVLYVVDPNKSINEFHPPTCHLVGGHGLGISTMLQFVQIIITNRLETCGQMASFCWDLT